MVRSNKQTPSLIEYTARPPGINIITSHLVLALLVALFTFPCRTRLTYAQTDRQINMVFKGGGYQEVMEEPPSEKVELTEPVKKKRVREAIEEPDLLPADVDR